MTHTPNPILVTMTRGTLTESVYRGAYCIVNHTGDRIASVGDCDRLMYPRSSMKPMQALAFLLGQKHQYSTLHTKMIALACSSHDGEDMHINVARQWLNDLNSDETALICGPSFPHCTATRTRLIQQNASEQRIYHMCSGKHIGFMCACRFHGYSLDGYTDWDHPVQRLIRNQMSELVDYDLHQTPGGIDGCQAPVVSMPLSHFALGLARMAHASQSNNTSLGQATSCIVHAVNTYPEYIAGTKRYCSQVISSATETLVVKMGAEGVFSAILPKRGLGIALKIDDGNLIAAEVALSKILNNLGILSNDSPYVNPPVYNSNKQVVGVWESKTCGLFNY